MVKLLGSKGVFGCQLTVAGSAGTGSAAGAVGSGDAAEGVGTTGGGAVPEHAVAPTTNHSVSRIVPSLYQSSRWQALAGGDFRGSNDFVRNRGADSVDRCRVRSSRKRPLLTSHRVLLALVALILLLTPGCRCGERFKGEIGPQAIDEVPADAVFYLGDHQGTPVVLTNARGEVIRRVEHHPYGSVIAERGADDPYAYVGNERDHGSGLSDFQARPYRPKLGIFLAPDPVAVFEPERLLDTPAALAPYTYAAADPVNLKDASGEIPTNAYEYIAEQHLGPRLPPAYQAEIEKNRPAGWLAALAVVSAPSEASAGVALGAYVARLAVSAAARRAAIQAGKALLKRVAVRAAEIATRRSRPTGVFARVMPREFAKQFRKGTGTLARENPHNEAFVTTRSQLDGIVTRKGAAERLTLKKNRAGTVLRTKDDTLVTFDVLDVDGIGLRSSIEVPGGRGYGFITGPGTRGGAIEWMMNNGTRTDLKACNISLTHLF